MSDFKSDNDQSNELNNAYVSNEIHGLDRAPPSIIEEIQEQKQQLKLGDQLIARGLISSDQLQIALREQQDSGKDKVLGAILVELGFVTENALGEIISERSGTRRFDFKSAILDSHLISLLPKEIAIKNKALPVSSEGDTIYIAINDVYNIMALDQLRRYFPRTSKLTPLYAPETQILEIIDQYYSYDMSIDGILKEIETGDIDKKSITGDGGYVNPTVRLVDALLVDAIKRGASDIHLEPEATFLRVRYRIDGKLIQIRSFHKNYWQAISVRIKIMSGMNIAESRLPQDGRIAYNVLGRDIDFRVATQPTIHGENIVLRILDKKSSLVNLNNLGMSEPNVNLLKKSLKRPEGIIIITGPTGSGKTTTLYSILNFINTIEKNIMTLEDPVEYMLPLIRQSNIREGAGLGFTEGIKSLMRQDPDIIFIGEVRDEETANMAIRAGMTGHQVFTTLHTNDALGAIPRLLDIGVQRNALSGSIICIIAQRLLRKLCEHCKKGMPATDSELKVLDLPHKESLILYKHVGCDKCNYSGYKGRVAISEVLAVDSGLDELIATGATKNQMYEYSLLNDFIPMMEDAIHKVANGITDLDEVIGTIDMTKRM
jgi:general secretion pathway protein E/type IV pilus assembly protein PilB